MPNIFYSKDDHGREYGKWPGVSQRIKVVINGVETTSVRKVGQRQLGYVIDKDSCIFFKSGYGIYQFNVETQACTDVSPEKLATLLRYRDERRREPPVVVLFGGSYFLDQFITGIGYDQVLDSIHYENRDRIKALIQYYMLSTEAEYHAETWYEYNYTKFIYPNANLASQRVSECNEAVGREENRRRFLMSHIKYLLKSTDEELCVIVDSTGCPNKCRVPYTRASNHDGDVNIEFRVIVVVQKSTGLPVYYEMIQGNVVDVNTIMTVMEKLKQYGYNVTYALGDAAYSCPSNIERLVLAGIDFLTRLNPTYDTYKKAVEENFDRLNDSRNNYIFNNRLVTIVKAETVVAHKKDSGEEVTGFVYLCRDHNAYHSRSTHLMNSKEFKKMSPQEVETAISRFGVFALASTKEIPECEILKEYYTRQAVEQFFDYAKNLAQYLPVRNHKVETLRGHLLFSFIACFLFVLIKNKLNILDCPYVMIPSSLSGETDNIPYAEIDTQQGTELMIRQEKQLSIFKSAPQILFSELQFQMADVFDDEIVPSVPTAGATEFYKVYRIGVPEYVTLKTDPDHTVPVAIPHYKDGDGNSCSRKIAFAKRSSLTNEQLEERQRRGDFKKLERLANKLGITLPENTTPSEAENATADDAPPTVKNKRGRPKKIKPEVEDVEKKPKRRGRPPGSKNKPKQEEPENQAQEAAAIADKDGQKNPSKNTPEKNASKNSDEG